MIYASSSPVGAFGETLARVRPGLAGLPTLPAYLPNEPEPLTRHLAGSIDPEDPQRGLLSAEWRARRVLASATLQPTLRCADLFALPTILHLREALGPIAAELGLADIDFSTVSGPARTFTQACASYVYDRRSADGSPVFAGIRYQSRLNLPDPDWECWAFFSDRVGEVAPGFPQAIFPDHPALLAVASLFRLTVEVVPGEYIRP